MTEGPRAHALVYALNNEVAGESLERVLARSRKLKFPVETILGRRLSRAEAFGKNIVLVFDEYAIRVHTLIYGIIRLYKRGDAYDKPSRMIRLELVFERHVLVGFNTPIIELDYVEEIKRRLESSLGPDPMRPGWNRETVAERLRARRDEKIGSILLDQSVIAGIGNILRNETLYRARINPERLVKELTDEEIERVITTLEELYRAFYDKIVRGENPRDLYLVYNRYRGRCVYCGTQLRYYRQEPHGRKTFVCPTCQR